MLYLHRWDIMVAIVFLLYGSLLFCANNTRFVCFTHIMHLCKDFAICYVWKSLTLSSRLPLYSALSIKHGQLCVSIAHITSTCELQKAVTWLRFELIPGGLTVELCASYYKYYRLRWPRYHEIQLYLVGCWCVQHQHTNTQSSVFILHTTRPRWGSLAILVIVVWWSTEDLMLSHLGTLLQVANKWLDRFHVQL